jgi:hypothetical protein
VLLSSLNQAAAAGLDVSDRLVVVEAVVRTVRTIPATVIHGDTALNW